MREQSFQRIENQRPHFQKSNALGHKHQDTNHVYAISCSHHKQNCALTGVEETGGCHWVLPSPRAQMKLHFAAVHDSEPYGQRRKGRLRRGHIMVQTQCLCSFKTPMGNTIKWHKEVRYWEGNPEAIKSGSRTITIAYCPQKNPEYPLPLHQVSR